jgi:disulfide bond formation protein DsbB
MTEPMSINAIVDRGRLPAAAVLAGSAALLMGALLFQYWGGLPPCPLCILQRYFHIAVAVLAGAAFLAPDPRWRTLLLGLTALVLLGSAGMALFHVGVEAKWWEGLPGCSGAGFGGISDDPSKLIQSAGKGPAARCDQVPWSFLGLSLAGWNIVASLVLAGIALYGLFRIGRRPA